MAYEKYTKTTPGAPLVTLAEMQEYLHVDDPAESDLIDALILGWTQWAEEYCWASFSETTWTLERDCWDQEILLSKNPVSEVTEVKYYDPNDQWTLMPASSYVPYIAEVPARIEMLDTPALNFRLDAVTIVFKVDHSEYLSLATSAIRSLIALQHLEREDFKPDGMYISLAKRILGPARLNYY